MSPEIIIFKTSDVNAPGEPCGQLIEWMPTVRNPVPPGKPTKYALFSLFHFAGVFKNAEYRFISYVVKGRIVSSMLVVPAFFRYPFMQQQDVQFTYVMTRSEYRNKGYAWQMIYLKSLSSVGDKWYVTTSDNIASQNLARKMGFELIGTGVKHSRLSNTLSLVPRNERNSLND